MSWWTARPRRFSAHIPQQRGFAQLVHEPRRPSAEFVEVGGLQRVLKQRLARTPADADVLHQLQEQINLRLVMVAAAGD
jgi:hypothetical protein